MNFIENKLVVTDIFNPEKSTFKTGDIITHINGSNIENMVDSLRIYYPASNDVARLRDISGDILRSQNDKININGKITQLYPMDNLNFYGWYRRNKSEKCYKLMEGNIGYVTLATINDNDIPEIKKAFENTKGIIVDIRNYPSAYVVYSLGSWFVSEPRPFVKNNMGSIENPGKFTFRKPLKIIPDGEKYSGKLVVIVNEITQSQAEYTAMALRAGDNTTIIGSQTAGADGNVSQIKLPGGLETWISGLGVYCPDGTPTQRIGILPDIEVKPTIKGIREGRDELLDKAIEVIKL